MEWSLFEEVADALRGRVPTELGTVRSRPRPYGVKVWFGGEAPPREHYEAQVVGADAVDDARVLALELGFHCEHPSVEENRAVLVALLDHERRWRSALGREPVAGPFLGRADRWIRISETWPDPDLGDPELSLQIAARLGEYVLALEPLRAQLRS